MYPGVPFWRTVSNSPLVEGKLLGVADLHLHAAFLRDLREAHGGLDTFANVDPVALAKDLLEKTAPAPDAQCSARVDEEVFEKKHFGLEDVRVLQKPRIVLFRVLVEKSLRS